jgi:hypothetical protein
LNFQDLLVSAEVLPPSLKINDLAFANCLSGALVDKRFSPNSLIHKPATGGQLGFRGTGDAHNQKDAA